MSGYLRGLQPNPSHCPSCGRPITEITCGQRSEFEPFEPRRFGCGCLAVGVELVFEDADGERLSYHLGELR